MNWISICFVKCVTECVMLFLVFASFKQIQNGKEYLNELFGKRNNIPLNISFIKICIINSLVLIKYSENKMLDIL